MLDIIPTTDLPPDQIIALALALEAESNHHVAIELRRYAKEQSIDPAIVKDVRTHENGITGFFDNKTVTIGSEGFMKLPIPKINPKASISNLPANAISSAIYMSLNGRICARLLFGDEIRIGAQETVEKLKEIGYALAVISGDSSRTTRQLANALGINTAMGSLLPEEKARFLEGLRKSGHRMAMVGDGVNDAPAMATADLAIAIHSGSHLGRELADITLMRGEPVQILGFLNLAEKTHRKVLQNLWFSFLYNFISIPLAMSGLLHPFVAVCAMLLSSLTVITNTLLLVRSASTGVQASEFLSLDRDSLDHPRN